MGYIDYRVYIGVHTLSPKSRVFHYGVPGSWGSGSSPRMRKLVQSLGVQVPHDGIQGIWGKCMHPNTYPILPI